MRFMRVLITWALWACSSIAMAEAPAPAPSALAQALIDIEQIPDAQHAERLRRLQSLQVPAAGLDALEHLFLLATTERAPAVAESQWRAWQTANPAKLSTLGTMAQGLAEVQRLLKIDRFRDAAVLARGLPAIEPHWPPLWRARALLAQGRATEEMGDPEAALVLRLQAVALLEPLNVPWRLARAMGALAFNYGRLNQHERALSTAKQGLGLAEQTKDLALQAWVRNILGAVHARAGDFRAARSEVERALATARRADDPRLLALLLANLSFAYLDSGNPARALQLAEEAYPLALKIEAKTPLSVAMSSGGQALIQLGQVAKGRDQMRRLVALELERGSAVLAAEGLDELGRALERVGDLSGAYQAFIDERELRETQTRKDRSEALAQAQSQFDGAQREREAQKLRQQTALQAETIRSQWLRFGLIALALVSGVVVLLIVGWLLRKLKHTNRKLAATNQDLAARSELDPLTGLGNRRRLQRLLSQQDPTEPLRAGLLLLDIDFFKQINDQYGHAAGDMVLTAVAGRMKRVAPQLEGLMRWGGEEFLVLMLGANAEQTTAAAAKTMEVLAGAPVSLRDGRSLRVTVSVGAVALPLRALALSAEQGVDLADALMYRAKSHGRNQAWCLEDAQARSLEELMHALSGTDAAAAQEQLRLQRLMGPGGSR